MPMHRNPASRRSLWAIGFILCAVASLGACDRQSGSSTALRTVTVTIQSQDGKTYPFTAEVAERPADMAQGLMGRETMPEDHGMLFIFPQTQTVSFWMKNTPLFLDMIFIAADGTIAHIHHRARPFDETRISSEQPVRAVLEINGGLAKEWNIQTGDKLTELYWKN
jgi:uncharacterized membrane protein (UPF0127 family)